ncbi:MAG: phosphatidate cytidylyltransferase [Pontimonas sp.]|jgi:phosphatidate cytidylyltransferase
MSTPENTPAAKKATRRFLPSPVTQQLDNLESVVSDIEGQVREVNARIDQRAGRPLWQAIAMGLLLGGAFVASLLWLVDLFVAFVTVLVIFAVLELSGALVLKGRLQSKWPLVILSAAMVPVAWVLGAEGQVWTLLGAIVVAAVIRAGRSILQPGSRATTLSDIGVAILVLTYIPFLGSFAAAIAATEVGELWVLAGVVIVVSVDTGAYVTGLSFGKTPMAPKISPKKTWEGFAGSSVAALLAGGLFGVFLLDVGLWVGLLLGAVLLGSATLGDLVESLIKRDLDIKDISSWLPGHGGFLDRLDSVLPSMAMLFVMFQIFAT